MTRLLKLDFPFREIHKKDFLNELGKAMVTVRFIPRGAVYRYYYKRLERYYIAKQIQALPPEVFVHALFLFRQRSCPWPIRGENSLA